MDFKKNIQEAKDKSKKRKFIQSMEIVFNFKNTDFSKQDNRVSVDVLLPKGRGKAINCGIAADDPKILEQAKTLGKIALSKEDITRLGQNKKEFKKVVRKAGFFLAQPQLMALIGKDLGQVLGPQGKMPKPIAPNTSLDLMIKRFENTVSLKSKGKFLPTIQAPFGTEDMSLEDLDANANELFNQLKVKVKGGEQFIRSIYVKTSMGPAVKVELPWQQKKEVE